MEQFEYVIIQCIWNAALESSAKAEHLYSDITNDKFYEACHELSKQILNTYLT